MSAPAKITIVVVATLLASSSAAQTSPSKSLRSRVGVEPAARLLRAPRIEDRIRGIRRASALGTPEALALLAQAADPGGAGRTEGRLALELARALAPHASQPVARTALLTLLNLATPAAPTRTSPAATPRDPDDGEGALRFALARSVAALALAQDETHQSEDALATIARSGGAGATAALLALEAFPPERAFLSASGALTPGLLHMAGATADLRWLDVLRAAVRSPEPALRAAALVALGQLGDGRIADSARAATHDVDRGVRIAAAEALARLGDREASSALAELLADEGSVVAAARLSVGIPAGRVTDALLGRLGTATDPDARRALVLALGARREARASAALADLFEDREVGPEAAQALARSPAPNAMALLEGLASRPSSRRLAARAYAFARMLGRGASARLEEQARALLRAADEKDRVAGVFVTVALGLEPAEAALADRAAAVRAAAAVALSSPWARRPAEGLAEAYVKEEDENARLALAGALREEDFERVPSPLLEQRVEGAGLDAPLALIALAARPGARALARLEAALRDVDPVRRAAAARGLGRAKDPITTGWLAALYRRETSPRVRYACVVALARRPPEERRSPVAEEALQLAARFDPEGAVRTAAARARAALPVEPGPQGARDPAWLRVRVNAELPSKPFAGLVLDEAGGALPVVFDEDGLAIVPDLPPGEARLVLAPRLASYEAPAP